MKILNKIKGYSLPYKKSAFAEAFGLKLPQTQKEPPALSLWADMYEGTAPWLSDTVHSLNLPAGIAAELSRLVTIDMTSEISGSKRADLLNEIYGKFLTKKRQFTEAACAFGGVVFKPTVFGKKIAVDFLLPDSFYPVSFDDSGKMTAAIFSDRQTDEDKFFTRLEYHHFENGLYIIENKAYQSSSFADLGREIPLFAVSDWKDIEPEVKIQNLDSPLFVYFKMPCQNGNFSSSPWGVSSYGNVCNLIKEADEQYSRLLWEFESGERALYLDNSAFLRDKNGKIILPGKRLYRTLSADESLFKDWSPAIRDESILRGLNAILKKIEFGCGLSYGTLSDETLKDRTAEEIRASKQRSYATVCDIQIALKEALSDLVYCLDGFISLYSLAPRGDFSISFSFDDSIIADRKTEFSEKLQLLNAGIMLPHEFRMWYFGEDENTALSTLNLKEQSL